MNTLSDLDLYLQKIQTHILCLSCRRNCEKKWFSPIVIAENAKKSNNIHKATALKHCLFCRHFHHDKDTPATVMKEVEWFFIKSGEDRFKSFYCEYAREASSWFLADSKITQQSLNEVPIEIGGGGDWEINTEINTEIDTEIDEEIDEEIDRMYM